MLEQRWLFAIVACAFSASVFAQPRSATPAALKPEKQEQKKEGHQDQEAEKSQARRETKLT